MLKRINIEDLKEDPQNSNKRPCITEFIQELNDNKKLVIGVSVFLIGKATIQLNYICLRVKPFKYVAKSLT